METMKVKPWGEGQGDHVLINAADFDAARHEPFDDEVAAASRDDLTAAEVLAMADGNFMAFKAAAKKLLGDDCPAKKDEIIADLKILAA